jgi:hypothetical protein
VSGDALEAWAGAAVGLGVSAALVWALRAAGWWDAHPAAVTAAFFAASVARGWAVRRAFRRWAAPRAREAEGSENCQKLSRVTDA